MNSHFPRVSFFRTATERLRWVVLFLALLSAPGLVRGQRPTEPASSATSRPSGGKSDAAGVRRDPNVFVYAMTPDTFADVNENDGKAAMRAWVRLLFQQHQITNEVSIQLLERATLVRGVAEGLVDAVTVNSEDYFQVRPWVDPSTLCVGSAQGKNYEEYILLVHVDSGFKTLADLQGRSLVVYDGARASLAPRWLDRTLAEQRLPRRTEFFGNLTDKRKLSAAILPVFFRSADACLTTLRGFETMAELNPQLGKRLTPLARSSPYVPVVFCIRKNYSPALRDPILAGIKQLQSSAAGQQLLTLFQTERMDSAEESCLDAARELLEQQTRPLAPSSPLPATPPSSATATNRAVQP